MAYKSKTVCIVVPCFNEEKQISKVIENMPDIVDKIVIINDKSTDNTLQVVKGFQKSNSKIVLIEHEKNQGVGGAIASGYKWARDNGMDVAVVMAGDAQMDPDDMHKILDPVVSNEADYAKGNRLRYPGAYQQMPKTRFFGNQILSFFTKIASGYWKITDAQNGYTAINARALKAIDWDKMYKRYGQPNDLLVRLNLASMRVCDCVTRPVYGVGEQSKMNIKRMVIVMPTLLLRLFIKRIYYKYMVEDLNIIAPLYFFGIANLITCLAFFSRSLIIWSFREMPEISFLISFFTLQMAVLLIVIAMYFDIQENDHLQARIYHHSFNESNINIANLL